MFFDVAVTGDATKAERPADMPEALWQQAQENNPDPRRFVPAQIRGFGQLRERAEAQEAMTAAHRAALVKIEGTLERIGQHNVLEASVKMQHYKDRHLVLCHRLVVVMRKLEVLRARGLATLPEESAFRVRLENLAAELSRVNRYKGRVSELRNVLALHEDAPPSARDARRSAAATEGLEEVMVRAREWFARESDALGKLEQVLQTDARDLTIIQDGGKR